MSEISSKNINELPSNSTDISSTSATSAKTVDSSATRQNAQTNASSGFTCPKCGAHKVAKSRSQGFDAWLMRFLPRRPYRCMRCYHRFWHKEAFFSDNRRIKSWLFLVAALLVIILVKSDWLSTEPGRLQSQNSAIGSDPPASSERNSGGGAMQGSQGNGLEIAKTASSDTNSLSIDAKRNLIENLSFNEPDEKVLDNSSLNLSPEELKLRLAQAKNKVEIAERQTLLKTEELQAELAKAPEEARSLARIDINYVIEQWRLAWENGDSASYLKHYSVDFKPNNDRSLKVWTQQRQSRVTPDRQIKLELSRFEVEFSEDNTSAIVRFDQRYTSKTYVDQSRKQLELKNQNDTWYIVSERQINAG